MVLTGGDPAAANPVQGTGRTALPQESLTPAVPVVRSLAAGDTSSVQSAVATPSTEAALPAVASQPAAAAPAAAPEPTGADGTATDPAAEPTPGPPTGLPGSALPGPGLPASVPPTDQPTPVAAAPVAAAPVAVPTAVPASVLDSVPGLGPDLAPAVAAPHVFTGLGFDACTAPSLTTLRAWKSSYGAVGIYIGGRNRACSQKQLTASWARSANSMGWHLLPLYVGSQAPCLGKTHTSVRMTAANAASLGASEGKDAAHAAGGLALAAGSPIYLDMEAYPHGGSCTTAVLHYTAAWTKAVRAAGYLSGFYSSADSGIADLSAAAQHRTVSPLPDVVWYARWDNRNSTDGYSALGAGQWSPHRRLHQFAGSTTETHGGVKLNIDRNAVDAPVAIVR